MEKNNKNNKKYNDRGEKSYGKGGPHRDGQRNDRRPPRDNKSVGKYDHVDHSAQAEPRQAAVNEELGSGIVIGRNAVRELLHSERTIDKLLVQRGEREGSIVVLVAQALEKKIPVVEVDRAKLDAMAGFAPHQGVIAMAAEKEYVDVEDILTIARERGEDAIIAIADGITDPYNLGALIRCAEGLGAHGLILPKRRAVGLTPLVSKASAGAIEHLAVAKVANLAQTVQELQKQGVWVYAAEAGGQSYDKTDLTGPCAIIFGSEGNGVSALLKQKCDAIISIPMRGQVNSLNVSTAASILLAEAARQHAQAREKRSAE